MNFIPQFKNGHDPIKYMFCNTKFNIITKTNFHDFLHVNYYIALFIPLQNVSEWMIANSVILQLYHGKNKLVFNGMVMMMRSVVLDQHV